MDVVYIVDALSKVPCDDALYLLKDLTEQSGFFASNGKLLYIAQGTNNKGNNIDTEYLSLRLHINIHAVQNNPSFTDGYYDVIILKEKVDLNIIESFVKLCCSHSQSINELNFRDFFYSLISLFQLPQDQLFKNALGFYGELKLIEHLWNEYQKDISFYWHKSGTFSKYDLSFNNFAFEVKTIVSQTLTVPIKHNQLFNSDEIFLCVLNCETAGIGETIEQVVKRLIGNPKCCNGFNFTLNLEKELKRISRTDLTETKFNLRTINIFKAISLVPFKSIPDEVSKLTYNYDLIGKNSLTKIDIKEILKNV